MWLYIYIYTQITYGTYIVLNNGLFTEKYEIARRLCYFKRSSLPDHRAPFFGAYPMHVCWMACDLFTICAVKLGDLGGCRPRKEEIKLKTMLHTFNN